MRKVISIVSTLALSLVLTGRVYADVPNLSIRIEQPKSPSNQTDMKLTVVTLDRQGRTITVKCYKKAPTDAGFVQFGSDIIVTPLGGNSVICDASSGVMSTNGTYQFQATAQADADGETSTAVSVDYNTSGPDTPTNYSKERVNVCDYKIKFRTADDGGKTVKVEVYRSENTSFSADNGTRVDTITIGSNTDGSSITTPPNCDTTYYFAVRAFDSAGNGSGLVGDSEVHTTTTTASGPSSGATQGAIPAGTAGNVLGEATGPTGGLTGASGAVIGESSPGAQEVPYVPPTPSPISIKTIVIALGAVVLLGLAWFLRKKDN
jgi:hypothetical protein